MCSGEGRRDSSVGELESCAGVSMLKKTPVIGTVERGGKVKAQVADDLTGKGVLKFIRRNVKSGSSRLITDEYQACNAVRSTIKHDVIKHKERNVDGSIRTNTIEGFWSLLKRAWYGRHHHYRMQFLQLYVAEACWKYNNRKKEELFDRFVKGCFARS